MKVSPLMKKNLRSIATHLIILLFILPSLSIADDRTKRVDNLFAVWDKSDSPGCALAIIKDGQIIYKKGYGMANLEHNIPLSSKRNLVEITKRYNVFNISCMIILTQFLCN